MDIELFFAEELVDVSKTFFGQYELIYTAARYFNKRGAIFIK